MTDFSKGVLVMLAVLGSGLLIACAPLPTPAPVATPLPSPEPGPPPLAPVATPLPRPAEIPLELKVAPGQSAYLPGEQVRIQLYVKNVGDETLEIDPFPPLVEIRRPRSQVAIWRSPADGQKVALGPDDSLTYEVIWDQRHMSGALVDPGYYYIEAKDLTARRAVASPPGSAPVAVIGVSSVAPVLVQHPQGAIDRTIEIDQTRTISGLAITLLRVELSPTGAMVFGVARPPGSSLPAPLSPPAVPTPAPTPPPHMYPVPAQYTLDGGPVRDAGSAGFTWLQDGIGLTWDLIDPVPNGTGELVFVITQFGELPGRWEWHIRVE